MSVINEQIKWVNKADIRQCKWVINYLRLELNAFFTITNDSELHGSITNYFYSWLDKENNKEIFIKRMKAAYALTTLPRQHFDWMDPSSDRLYSFAWFLLKNDGIVANFFEVATCHKERKKLFHEAFDTWVAPKENKLKYLNKIKYSWLDLLPLEEKFSWLKKEKTQCSWAWSYIKKPKVDIAYQSYPLVSLTEVRNAIITSIDLFEAPLQKKVELIQRMKKAWEEKVKRANIKAKKLKSDKKKQVKKQTAAFNKGVTVTPFSSDKPFELTMEDISNLLRQISQSNSYIALLEKKIEDQCLSLKYSTINLKKHNAFNQKLDENEKIRAKEKAGSKMKEIFCRRPESLIELPELKTISTIKLKE